MKIIDYFLSDCQGYWLSKIETCEWEAGCFLSRLLRENRFYDFNGSASSLLLLTEGDELVSFCTLAEFDDIMPTELTPWIGFVYTFPAYRNQGFVGLLLDEAETRARQNCCDYVYISTSHSGFYERYGYVFYKYFKNAEGIDSRVYRKLLNPKNVRITVVKMIQHEDLMAQYENPIEHTCDMKVGDSYISYAGQCPEGFCDSAWSSVKEFVAQLSNGGGDFYDGWMKNPHSAMISCNDGFRPVSFLVETIE